MRTLPGITATFESISHIKLKCSLFGEQEANASRALLESVTIITVDGSSCSAHRTASQIAHSSTAHEPLAPPIAFACERFRPGLQTPMPARPVFMSYDPSV